MSIRAYKYRLYPNKKQQEKLQWTLDRCRELYNASLQDRTEPSVGRAPEKPLAQVWGSRHKIGVSFYAEQ